MQIYSQNLNFEMALELKQELEYISIITDKQKIELHDLVNKSRNSSVVPLEFFL